MAIHVVRYSHEGKTRWGVLDPQAQQRAAPKEGDYPSMRLPHGRAQAGQPRIAPIEGDYPTTGDFLGAHDAQSLAALTGQGRVELSAVQVLSPVTRNQQFICQGANYRQHMIESGVDPDAKHFNMIFTKASSCIVAADSPVVRPAHVRFLDYEIELGLVMKRDITHAVRVTDANLHEFVAAVVIVNDYSARDIQIPEMQFYKGKSYRTFGPVGPFLCLLAPGEMHYLGKLDLVLKVNGEVRQRDSSANLVHRPAATLTELSGVQDLYRGDLLATGTPAGCALSVPSPLKQRLAALVPEKKKWELFMRMQARRTQYLKPGDVVEAEIRSADGVVRLGVQRNVVQ